MVTMPTLFQIIFMMGGPISIEFEWWLTMMMPMIIISLFVYYDADAVGGAFGDDDDEKDHNLNAIMSMNTHDMLIYEPTYCM